MHNWLFHSETYGPGISEIAHVKVNTHSDPATYDVIAYIKLIISQKPDIVITYSGVNDLTKDMTMMSMAQKVAVAVKEIDTKGKLKLIFSGVYC